MEKIVSRKDGKLDRSDLLRMDYLERCIKESLRLFPPVPRFIRHMTEDLQLSNVHSY